MSPTRMSTLPSRSTSAKSTAIDELLVLRTARRGTARKVPVPSFSQNMWGSSKSSHTYRSGEPGLLRPLGEDAVAVVHEERDASAERADEQIEVAVTVDVGEHGTRGMATGQRDAGSGRDVFEVKVAEVAVQGVRALVARQVDVGEAVAV